MKREMGWRVSFREHGPVLDAERLGDSSVLVLCEPFPLFVASDQLPVSAGAGRRQALWATDDCSRPMIWCIASSNAVLA